MSSIHDRILEAIADLLNGGSIFDAHYTENYLEIYDPEHDTTYEVVLKPLA